MPERTYYIVDRANGDEEWFMSDEAALVPHETLDEDRKAKIESGETNKLFKHGGGFPVVYIQDILDILDEHGRLEGLIDQCREARAELDKEGD